MNRRKSAATDSRVKYLDSAMRTLNSSEHKAIVLRFWKRRSIQEIANEFHMSWNSANEFIETILKKLKTEIIKEMNEND